MNVFTNILAFSYIAYLYYFFYIRIRIEFGTYSMYESIGNGLQFKNLLNFHL